MVRPYDLSERLMQGAGLQQVVCCMATSPQRHGSIISTLFHECNSHCLLLVGTKDIYLEVKGDKGIEALPQELDLKLKKQH